MEAASKTSRKRKQRSSSSTTTRVNSLFNGVVTRQKSQKFFYNRNRSGKSRKCRLSQHPFSQIPTSLPPQLNADRVGGAGDGGGGGDDEESHVSIKDLRARRVFSERPEEGKVENPSFDSDLIDCKVGDFDGFVENPSFSIKGKPGSGIDFKGEGFNCGNPNLVMLNQCELGMKSEDSGSGANVVDKCDEFEISSIIDGLISGNPILSVSSEKFESVVDCENPNLSVLKKCNSGVSGGSLNSFVSGKCDDSRVSLVADGLNGGMLNQSVASEMCDSVMKGGASNELESANAGNSNSSEKCDDGVGCGGKVSDDLSPNVINESENGRVGENGEVVKEENVQATPPDAVVLVRKFDESNASQSRSSVSAEGKHKKDTTQNRGSRRKVFKVPNSFTYRRLLPYLTDVAKDEPCELEVHPSLKTEMDVEERPSISQEVSIDRKDEHSMDPETSNSCSEYAAIPTPVSFAADKSEANLVSRESEIRSQLPDDPKQGLSQDEHISSGNLGKLGDVTPTGEPSLALTLHSRMLSPEASKNDATSETPCELSVTAVSCGAPVVGLANGILKKNPRGCRGICSCLNCASFRLNAEKAFEFSRNQLLEAEELTQDLMKELSNLRQMLIKSVPGTPEVEIVPDKQVQEACRRACNVEDMARSRLSQMNEDLFVHCRTKALQRPRVNFSGNVQEKAVEGLTKQTD